MRDPSLKMEKPAPFPKVVMLLPRGLPTTTLGMILSANTTSDQETKKEYYVVPYLSGTITTNVESWLVHSGDSKHLTRYRRALAILKEKKFSIHVTTKI